MQFKSRPVRMLEEANALLDAAETANRDLTPDEREHVEHRVAR